MCFIFGGFLKENFVKFENLERVFKISKNRGPDCRGIFLYNTNNKETNFLIEKNFNNFLEKLKEILKNKKFNIFLVQGLLSINNFVCQPFLKKENQLIKYVFISNSEIYNFKDIKESENLEGKNDSEILFNYLIKDNQELTDKIKNLSNNLNGPFAFSLLDLKKNEFVLSRDLVGVKPLNYLDDEKNFIFSSEKKFISTFLTRTTKNHILIYDELNIKNLEPNKILIYNFEKNNLKFSEKNFFDLKKQTKDKNFLNYEIKKKELVKLFLESVKLRANTDKKIGLLFSGGLDSTIISLALKKLNKKFSCYVTNFSHNNIKIGKDLIYSKKIAKEYNLDLKIVDVTLEDVKKNLKKVMNIIESYDFIKVSVALPFYFALKEAKKDGVKVIFSGIGSEENFAGYNKYYSIKNINKFCLEKLKDLHIRDLYRDDLLASYFSMELRVPFLDNNLLKFTLNLNPNFKIDKIRNENKIILRDISFEYFNLKKEFAFRKKSAAQYGSKVDKILLRLAKDKNLKKSELLKKVYFNEINFDL